MMNDLFQKAATELGLNAIDMKASLGQDILKISKDQAELMILEGNRIGHTSLVAAELAGNRLSVKLCCQALGIPQPKFHSFIIEDPMELNVHLLERENAAFVKDEHHYTLRPAHSNDRHGCRYNLFDHAEMLSHLQDFADTYATWVLEEELEGKRYQLLVLKGEILAAISKQSFGLTGDGESSLEELMDAYNRKLPQGAELLAVDAQMRYLLREQDIFLSDIPSRGQFVRLQEEGEAASVTNASEVLQTEHHKWAADIAHEIGHPFFSLEILIDDLGNTYVIDLDPAPEWTAFDLQDPSGLVLAKEILSKML